MVVYLTNVYGDAATEKWFRSEYKARGKKLDMGKSCVRFKSIDDLPLDLIGEAIAKTPVDAHIAKAEKSRAGSATRKGKAQRATGKGKGTTP